MSVFALLSGSLTFVVWVVIAGLVGAVLHELTHLVVARLAGRDAWVEWTNLNVRHELPLSGPALADRIVGAAPLAVGAVVGVGWWVASLPLSAPAAVGWGVYTLGGVPNDFRV